MNIKLTKKRQRILDVLRTTKSTLSAQEIHKKLAGVDQATVYRSLDFFVKNGLVTKVHLGTDEARYEYQDEPHHHAVCTNCDRIIHFKTPNEKLKKLLSLSNFDIENIEITVKGNCKD